MLAELQNELSLFADLQKELSQRKVEGLLRQRRLLDSPQAEHIVANDKKYLSFNAFHQKRGGNLLDITVITMSWRKSSRNLSTCLPRWCFQPAIWRILA